MNLIKNQAEYDRLISEGWETCEVEGQLNPPESVQGEDVNVDDMIYYDAETDKIKKI